MKHIIFSFFIILFFTACSFRQESIGHINTKTQNLSMMIIKSSSNINKNEAKQISQELVTHSLFLSKKYGVNTSALFHNTLINMEFKERGLCYHYADDLIS